MRTCPKCGAEVTDNAAFCTKCGEKLEAQQAASENTASQNQAGENDGQSTGGGYNYGGYTYANNQNTNNQNAYNQNAYNGGANFQGGYAAPVNPYDHTAEFTAKDISENKVIAMATYLLGIAGIIIALLGSHSSPYAGFHVRQSMKFLITEVLLGIVALILCWTIVVPLAAGLAYLVLFVVRIICFFSVCNGKAKEPAIIRSFGFLR